MSGNPVVNQFEIGSGRLPLLDRRGGAKRRGGCDFPSDLVLYYRDPTYDWSPINQLKRFLKGELGKSKLSVRVLADALQTSPAQVVRLLAENRASKHILQLMKLAELAGYQIEFRLRKKRAA
jgi:hypothetical protein